MTPQVQEGTDWMYETLDVNIIPDSYVTWIVDLWKGNRDDPAVDVNRYIGVWDADVLEDQEGNAVDPGFKDRSYYGGDPWPTIKPVHWHLLDSVKAADPAARQFKKQQEDSLNTEGYNGRRNQQYVDFMEAIEILVDDPENEDAWAKIEKFRSTQALQHEK